MGVRDRAKMRRLTISIVGVLVALYCFCISSVAAQYHLGARGTWSSTWVPCRNMGKSRIKMSSSKAICHLVNGEGASGGSVTRMSKHIRGEPNGGNQGDKNKKAKKTKVPKGTGDKSSRRDKNEVLKVEAAKASSATDESNPFWQDVLGWLLP